MTFTSVFLKAFLTAALGSFLLTACSREEQYYVESLEKMESPTYRGQQLSDARIEEIKEAIARYKREVEAKVEATAQIGIYYKMLALQYMERRMYAAAYDSLEQALRVHPENPILFYYSGVCAAHMAQAQVDEQAGNLWLERAEKLYRRAIALDPGYVDALYGLAILLVFELDRPEAAEEPLRRILEIEEGNVQAMFLLGNLYYRLGRLEDALAQYREAAATTTVPERRREAEANQKRIEEELYGLQ